MDRPQWAGEPGEILDENTGARDHVRGCLSLSGFPSGPDSCLPGGARFAEEAGGPAGPVPVAPGSTPSIPHLSSTPFHRLTRI